MLGQEHVQATQLLLLLRWQLTNRLLQFYACLHVCGVSAVAGSRLRFLIRFVQADPALVLQHTTPASSQQQRLGTLWKLMR